MTVKIIIRQVCYPTLNTRPRFWPVVRKKIAVAIHRTDTPIKLSKISTKLLRQRKNQNRRVKQMVPEVQLPFCKRKCSVYLRMTLPLWRQKECCSLPNLSFSLKNSFKKLKFIRKNQKLCQTAGKLRGNPVGDYPQHRSEPKVQVSRRLSELAITSFTMCKFWVI